MSVSSSPLKLAIIAGEKSGDLLGADLISAVRNHFDGVVEPVGVGGDAMAARGLVSYFNYEELSIIGFSAVIARLPQLLLRIRQTAKAIIAAEPSVLIIIDSPDFTHRVARLVHRARPDLPIINYVCPTVWAWKPERASTMTEYVDHVLSLYPFEPGIVARLGGPPVTYVGHRMASDPALLGAAADQCSLRERRASLPDAASFDAPSCLLLPGSRAGELKRLLPSLRRTASEVSNRAPDTRFVIPTLPRFETTLRSAVSEWEVAVEIVIGDEAKWQAFSNADVAVAASGTVLLELALVGVPCISVYKLDPIAKFLMQRITAWTGALPNFIADYPVINEYVNESVRPGLLARRVDRLSSNSVERREMLKSFDKIRGAMKTARPASETAAEVVLNCIRQTAADPETKTAV